MCTCTKKHNHMRYSSWDTEWDRIFCHFGPFSALFILGNFLHFCSPHSPKSENFKKKKKTSGDFFILHKCTKIHDHMLYCAWNYARDRCNYFSFWDFFCTFTLWQSKKSKLKKKKKKTPGDIITLHKCTKNYD